MTRDIRTISQEWSLAYRKYKAAACGAKFDEQGAYYWWNRMEELEKELAELKEAEAAE